MNSKVQQLFKIKKNKEVKTLLSNFFSLSLLQIAGYVFPLLTLPYLARVIGVEKFGEIAFASAVLVYFQTLIDYGFILSAVRDIARCKNDKLAVSEIYSKVMWARFLLTGLAFVLLVFLIIFVPYFYQLRYILLLSFLLIPGHAMFPDWMFQALEKMKYITIFNVLVKFIFTIAVFIFIKKQDDYLLQPIFSALGYIISGACSMCLIRKWGIKIQITPLKTVLLSIKANTDLFINQFVPNLYNSLSVLLLGFFHGSTANGIFDAGNKFNTVATRLLIIVSRTFFPFLSRKIEKHGVLARINISLSALMAIALFFFAPLIIHIFFTKQFETAIIVLRIMSISLIFSAMSNVYIINWLIINGYERDARKITVVASLAGFIIAVPLVYFYSYIGAALTILVSRGVMGCGGYLRVVKLKRKKVVDI